MAETSKTGTFPVYYCSVCERGFDSLSDMAHVAFGYPTNIYSKGVDVCKECGAGKRQPKEFIYYGMPITLDKVM